MSNDKKRRISGDVVLVLVGVVAVLSLQCCDSDNDCRYVYQSRVDCESDWGSGGCRQQDAKYYSPAQAQCSSGHSSGGSGGSYGGGSDGKGEHAIGVERGGFGGSSRGFWGGS